MITTQTIKHTAIPYTSPWTPVRNFNFKPGCISLHPFAQVASLLLRLPTFNSPLTQGIWLIYVTSGWWREAANSRADDWGATILEEEKRDCGTAWRKPFPLGYYVSKDRRRWTAATQRYMEDLEAYSRSNRRSNVSLHYCRSEVVRGASLSWLGVLTYSSFILISLDHFPLSWE